MFIFHPRLGTMWNVHLPLFSHREYHLWMEVLRYSAFIAAIRYDECIFVSGYCLCLKPLICLTALRRYTEDIFLLVIPAESASNHFGQAYNIIDFTTLDIILLFNVFGPPSSSVLFGVRMPFRRWISLAIFVTMCTFIYVQVHICIYM